MAAFQGIPGELGAVGQIGPRVSRLDFFPKMIELQSW